jgi:hypothetical protein
LLPWKSYKYYIFVCARACACNLAYPVCNSYAPYCDVICITSGSTTLHHKRHDFRKMLLNIKCVFWLFSTTFV